MKISCWVALLHAVAVQSVVFPNAQDRMVNSSEATTSFSISATLGDHMVLQRAPASAVVWGFASPGATVTTTFIRHGRLNAKYTSVAGSDGVWRAHLEPTAAGGPYTINFASSTGETAAINDVLFGDVYICGGQSNMQFSVGGNVNGSTYAKEADSYPNIRLFTVGQVPCCAPRADLHVVCDVSRTTARALSCSAPPRRRLSQT